MRYSRIIALLLVLSMCVVFSACQKNKEDPDPTAAPSASQVTTPSASVSPTATPSATAVASPSPAASETPTQTPEEGDLLLGRWVETVAHRAVIEITEKDGALKISVTWPESAAERILWDLEGQVNEDLTITYKGTQIRETYDESGNATKEVVNDACTGTMAFRRGELYWSPDGEGEPSIFERESLPESEG